MNVRSKSGFLILGMTLLGWHPAWAKEIEQVAKPPPLAKAGSASVYLPESADIPLNIGGRVVEPLSFLIRKPPRHGTLGNVRQTGRTSAVVTYTPDAKAVPGEDVFTFAAQSMDSPVSAPASVWIRLLEKPPVLEHVGVLDFGTVYLGDTAGRELVLKNIGGGRAIGQLRATPPWSVSGNSTYQVTSGSAARMGLVFRPAEERDFSDKVRLGDKAFVELRGTGAAPITWPKAGLVFSPEQRAKGFAEVAVTNQSPQERTLIPEWPDFVKAPRAIPLAPGETAVVKAEITGPVTNVFQGSVNFRFGNFTGGIPLTVYPQPARLVLSESTLELGDAPKGKELRGKFTVKNTGETDAPISIPAPDEMLITPDPRNLVLEAGGERAFEIRFSSFKPGRHSETIVVRTPAGEPAQLQVHASVRDTTSLSVEKFLAIPESDRAPEPTAGNAAPVTEISPALSTPHEIEISWKATSPETAGFRIERRRISIGKDDRPLAEWFPWPEARVRSDNGTARARFERLPENTRWTIRIIGLDALGNPGPASLPFQISTQPGKHFVVPVWAWLGLLAAAVAGVIRLAIHRRKALLAREDARRTRIEAK